MFDDPIVEEVRKAGAKMAEECGYDLHAFAEMIRKNQKESSHPIFASDKSKKLNMTGKKIK